MSYDVTGKCIHLWKVLGLWEEGKIFRCDKCREVKKAQENKPKFNSSMRSRGMREGGSARTGEEPMTKRKPASEWVIKRNRAEILRMYEEKVGVLSIAVRLGVSAYLVRYVLDGRPDPITGEIIDYDSSGYMPETFSITEMKK